MAKRPTSRAKTSSSKRSSGKRNVHRTIPRTPDEIDDNLPVVTEPTLHDPTQLAGDPTGDFWSFPLNNLIRVDWSRRVEMFPHAPGKSSLQSIVYGDLTYDVESLDPRTMGNADIELLPECRYYIVPIREEDQSQVAPRRLLLVRRRRNGEKLGPHIWIIGADDADQTVETYASLHIIGSEEDMIADASPLQPVGIVEAMLTATPISPSETSTAQPPQKPPQPPQPPQAQMNEPPSPNPPRPLFTLDDRNSLRQTLEQRFNRDELRSLTTDLGINHENIPQTTIGEFSRELVGYCERRSMLGCLASQAFHLRRDDEVLKRLTGKLPPCNPLVKIQIFLNSSMSNQDEVCSALATILGINSTEIEILGSALGSLRLLISLPSESAHNLFQTRVDDLVLDGNQVISITPFDSLDLTSQQAWRFIANRGTKNLLFWNGIFALLSGEPDPDLLACIDYFHEAKAIYTNCGPALTRVQQKFYAYLRDKFDYGVIPIADGTTSFSYLEGYRLTERPVSTRLVNVPSQVITRVLKDGYKRGQDVKRWAEVVTNQPPITMLRRIKRVRRGRLYVEMETPTPLAIEQLIAEATGHFRLIDGIYAVLALVDSQSGDLNSLAAILQRYTNSSLPLAQVSDRLYEQLQRIGISRASMRLRYALRDAPRDRQFEFIVIGNAKLLDETREIIIRQAARQDSQSYFVLPDVEWLKTRLTRLRQQIGDQIAEALARGIATFLSSMAFASDLLDDQVISTIEFAPADPSREQQLTPEFMASAISPYLVAIDNIQALLDRILRRESGAVIITDLQANPIHISFRGGRAAVRVIREDVLPWRQDNVWQLDGINTRRIRMKDLEKKAKTSVRARTRKNILRDEIAGREESLKKDESRLALNILQENGLDLSKITEADQEKWVRSILPSLATIIDSDLQLTSK